jgi:nucleotide-binding universal stress UspA family protein
VLVGTDLSPASREAVQQGAQLARDLESRLIVCHVIPELLPDGSVFTEFRRANADVEQSVVEKARAAIEDELDGILESGDADVDVILEFGSPHVGLLSHAEATGAGVVVTGPGSVGLDVVRHVAGAVLIARRSPHGPVVAATDFSDPAVPALHLAASEARRRGLPLHLIHAFDAGAFALGHAPEIAMPYLATSSPIALEGLDELQTSARTRLEETLREVGLAGKTDVIPGRAAGVVVRYAEKVAAALVVIGTHGRSGFARLTLGSTAASIVESAPCSVLVVRLGVS